jgi:hypothetical protein
VETIRFASYSYPEMTQDPSGNWSTAGTPTLIESGDWGTLRIETGAVWDTSGTVAVRSTPGTDITTINSVPTLVDALTFGEPYGELTGQLTLPELAPFDDLTAIGAQPGANIDIYRVLPAALAATAGTAEVPYWHGIIASYEMSDGPGIQTAISLQLTGALYGEASVRQHQPLMLDTAYDVGSWAGRALDYALYDRPFSPFTRFTFESDTTGIEVRYRGSRGQSTIDYLDELLALAQDQTNQWTIARAYKSYGTLDAPRPRHYYIRAKSPDFDTAIQQNTVYMGGYGIAVSLSSDVTEAFNVVYGEGVHPVGTSELSGSRWRNSVYPMLNGTVPTYPDRISGADFPVTTGDTDGLFTTDVITQLTSQLRLGGYPDVTIGTAFTSTVGSAIVDWKQDIEYSNTNANIGGTAEWAKLFESGTGYTDLTSGWFKPLAWDPTVSKYVYTASGDVAGTATGYDERILRVETTISYGENVPKKRARINARRIRSGDTPPVMGTITLTSDPVDETPAGRSRFDIREGAWIYLYNWTGGNTAISFYIAGVTHSPEAFTTTLTVSSRAFDLLDLSTRLERNRSAKSDPAKSFYSQRTSTTRPFRSAVGWDAELGGTIPRFSAAGSAWTVAKFPAAQYGSIGALRVDTAPDSAFCFAVFGGSVSPTFLNSITTDPLGSVSTSYPSHWQTPGVLTALGTAGFIEAWGSFGEAAGYYPGAESIGAGTAAGSVTGRLEDAGSWSFASYEPPWLWCAIWPRTSGTVTVDAQMRIIQDEG